MKTKNLILGLVLCLSFCAPSFAQETEKQLTPEEESFCAELSRTMASEIRLTESEFILLKTLNREMIIKAEAITDTYRNDPATKEKKMKEIITAFNNKLKPVLKPYQLQAFQKYKLDAETWLVSASKVAETNTTVN